ncbi:uncharacterized protein YbbK (DUF523 family) [Wenyingzhuangia heitensis]|uniref:Uncharacterized protein YbbK (DUF523 family) n=1 Tax=Wenyingzhuangia heitensis TaxID=1487859 RepID=A0ABX0U6S4_9FLAO|nr:DUF523 domain-containing protein [Wenyingzhuangia heitensis]NIJ44487.1 uncharacterized protein YbbK (DUF523 family) [Wenyingzhuangia heitensis]
MKVVSACLAGIACRFDGKSKSNSKIIQLIKEGKAIAVCPEELGGLSTPRTSAEQQGDKIISQQGIDLTQAYTTGAKKALAITIENKCTDAILKSNSPSCGCGKVYDGSFTGKLTNGDGIFCKTLKQHHIKVITEKDL